MPSVDDEVAIAFESYIPALSRLARRGYSTGAEDIVQEACLAVLIRLKNQLEPGACLDIRVRRLAVHARHSELHRRDREKRVARQEALPDTADVVAEFELVQMLHTAVEELLEPGRSAIRMRFLEGLTPRAIAKRLGVPVSTVRTRVRRGLERLRKNLGAGGPLPGQEEADMKRFSGFTDSESMLDRG
jgi:RNA polymerase sigma factor (sigma-70 family)